MFQPKYTVTARMLKNLAKIEMMKYAFESKRFSTQLLRALRQVARLGALHYLTAIEGNTLTLGEVVKNIQGKHFPKKEQSEKEARTYDSAYRAMVQAAEEKKPLTPELIAELHALLEGAAEEAFRPLNELCAWVQSAKELPVPLVAGVVHYQFVTLHPYADGNGRLARLLVNFVMCAQGYDLNGIYAPEEYYANNLMAYYSALQENPCADGQADITGWLEYFLAGVVAAFEKVNAQTARQPARNTLMSKSPLVRELDTKQRKILKIFERFKEVNSAQIAKVLVVPDQSARALIRSWLASGFLVCANESKKARTYRLNEQYEELLG